MWFGSSRFPDELPSFVERFHRPRLRERLPGHVELHWDCEFQWAVRRGEWKLRYADGDAAEVQGIRKVEHADPGSGLGLYHLATDIGETHDVADQHPDIVAASTARHHAWRTRVGLPAGAMAQV